MTSARSKEQALIREDTVFPERITARQCALTAVKSANPKQKQGRTCTLESQCPRFCKTICIAICITWRRQSPH